MRLFLSFISFNEPKAPCPFKILVHVTVTWTGQAGPVFITQSQNWAVKGYYAVQLSVYKM